MHCMQRSSWAASILQAEHSAGLHINLVWFSSLLQLPSMLTCDVQLLTQQFMTNIRLWSVHRLAVVPHILCAVECAEGKAVQEVPRVQQPCNRPYLPPCCFPALH